MARLTQWPEMVAERGLVLVQRSRHEDLGDQAGAFERMRSMRYGETVVDLYRRAEGG
jgi:16S rRNA G966 N2-methylase RsmD